MSQIQYGFLCVRYILILQVIEFSPHTLNLTSNTKIDRAFSVSTNIIVVVTMITDKYLLMYVVSL